MKFLFAEAAKAVFERRDIDLLSLGLKAYDEFFCCLKGGTNIHREDIASLIEWQMRIQRRMYHCVCSLVHSVDLEVEVLPGKYLEILSVHLVPGCVVRARELSLYILPLINAEIKKQKLPELILVSGGVVMFADEVPDSDFLEGLEQFFGRLERIDSLPRAVWGSGFIVVEGDLTEAEMLPLLRTCRKEAVLCMHQDSVCIYAGPDAEPPGVLMDIGKW